MSLRGPEMAKRKRKREKKRMRRRPPKRISAGVRGEGLMDTDWDAFLLSLKSPPSTCPRCQGELKKEYGIFLLVTPEEEWSITSANGLFCQQCTVLLLDEDDFNDRALLAGVTDEYRIVGLVDLEAIPEDKRDMPIGEPGNPIPLVEFNSFRLGSP
jgi:hypothetical protein